MNGMMWHRDFSRRLGNWSGQSRKQFRKIDKRIPEPILIQHAAHLVVKRSGLFSVMLFASCGCVRIHETTSRELVNERSLALGMHAHDDDDDDNFTLSRCKYR